MKKHILLFLLFTGFLQAQTYPVNPTKFGKISLNTNGVSTSTTKINTQESDGQINYIDAVNLPVPTSVTNAIESKTENSAGAIQGFAVTNNGNGTVNIATGTAFLRATNDQYAPLVKYTIPAVTNLALTDNANNYVLVDYNGGSPALTVTTNSATINTTTNSLAILISRVGTTLDYLSLVSQNNDANAKIRIRFLNQEGIRRANGAIIGFASRNLTLTAGTLFSGLIRINSPAFNTASPDTFTYVYNNGAVWTRVTGRTQVNNTQYNNAGTLTTMPSNDFRVDYIYLLPNNPSKLYVVYGSTTYNNITLARNAPTPTALPSELQVLGVLVGRQIIQKDAVSISEVSTAFDAPFTGVGVPEHNALSGLQGGAVNDYQHVTTIEKNSFIAKQNNLSWKTPQDYGAIGNGVADDTDEIQAALNANSNVLFYGTYKISAPIQINHGQYIFGNNVTITTSSNTITLLNANAKFYWKIDGNIILQGTGKENNTAIGLNIIGGSNYSVQGVSASGISGYGIKLTQGASMGDRGERGRFSNISIQDCWTGVEVGTSYEYISFNQLNASGNAFAMTILAGNVNVNNSNLNDNDAGLYVGGALSTNNSHGIVSNSNINHNTEYNVFCENVEYGQTFNGCHIYGTPSGSIEIVDSNGVLFNGCIIDGVLNNSDSQATKGAIILANTQLEPDYSNTGGIVYYKNCFSRTDDQLTSAIYDNGTNVGIGTRTPTAYAGYTTLAVDGVNGSVFEMARNNVNAYSVVVDNAMTTIGESRNLPINFNVNTIDVLTLLPTGNAEFTGTVKVDPAVLGTDAVNKDQLDAAAGSSGSYTPTITTGTNVTSVTAPYAHTYTKIGNIVTVYGFSVPVLTNTAIDSDYTITLPFARATGATRVIGFGNTDQAPSTELRNVSINSETTTTAIIRLTNTVTGSVALRYSFQYDITQ